MYVWGATAVITHRLTPPFLLEGVKTVINDVETMRLAAVAREGERSCSRAGAHVGPGSVLGQGRVGDNGTSTAAPSRAADKPVCLIRRRSTAVPCRAKPLIRAILCVEHTDPRLCESKSNSPRQVFTAKHCLASSACWAKLHKLSWASRGKELKSWGVCIAPIRQDQTTN